MDFTFIDGRWLGVFDMLKRPPVFWGTTIIVVEIWGLKLSKQMRCFCNDAKVEVALEVTLQLGQRAKYSLVVTARLEQL